MTTLCYLCLLLFNPLALLSALALLAALRLNALNPVPHFETLSLTHET